MPVIEQAKGIMMAQCGWSEEQAFDALRGASQRENIKMRDLAARIVTQAVRSAAAQRQPGPAAAAATGTEAVSHARIVSTIAGAAARRQPGQAAG